MIMESCPDLLETFAILVFCAFADFRKALPLPDKRDRFQWKSLGQPPRPHGLKLALSREYVMVSTTDHVKGLCFLHEKG